MSTPFYKQPHPKSHYTKVVFSSTETGALGQLQIAAFKPNNPGVLARPMRVLGQYSITYLLDGSGTYGDANGHRQRVESGDFIFIFPDVAHHFGPDQHEHWSAFYITFCGPAFDLWRKQGVLDASHPVRRIAPIEEWLPRFEAVYSQPASQDVMVARLLEVLTEVVDSGHNASQPELQLWWFSAACKQLQQELQLPLSLEQLAREVGMPAETLRKRFKVQAGISPMRYRLWKRLEASRSMIEHTTLSGQEIARQLGFSDEAHFSRQFKNRYNLTPREYRRQRIIRISELP